MKDLKPALFTSLKGYTRQQLVRDIVAGVIVAIIALPLSIALALASGVGPEQGIYTAIIAGLVISFFGGSTVQISGPTAAFAAIVAGIVAENGLGGLAVATIMAGIFLILMGLFHFGSLIKFIPSTITTGFTAGIAVTIVIGQLKDFFGVTYAEGVAPIEAMEKLEVFFRFADTINVQALVVGLVCLAVMIIWPYIPKIGHTLPNSLPAILVGILMVKGLGMEVNTIGDLYTIRNQLPSFRMPDFTFDTITQMVPDAFTIAILAAIESLLSCVVADGMVGTRHNSNMELVAQGMGNICSAFFGGIPATGAIARTAANIKNGGRSPIAGIVHALVLVLILVVLMPYAAWIPMPTIAAILFMVAYNMCQWRAFTRLVKTAPKSDILVLVITFVLTVLFDLVVAIEVGMVLACLMFIKRMSEETEVRGWKYDDSNISADDPPLRPLPKYIRVYEITGPMFFGAVERLAKIRYREFTKCLVLRMRGVPAIDATVLSSLEALYEDCKKHGITLVFSHVNEQPMHAMEKCGLVDKVGRENFCPHIDAALDHAEAMFENVVK